MEATHLSEHSLLAGVQLEHTQYRLEDLDLYHYRRLGRGVELVQEGAEVHRAV